MIARLRRFLRVPAALAAMVALLMFGGADVARAQDPVADFFQGLFGGGRQYRPQHRAPSSESPRMRRLVPHREYGAPPAYWHGQGGRAAKKVKPQKPAADPAVQPSFFVAVIGDSLGQMLADGLDEAYADRSEIRVLRKAKESSGLVRTDFYDWPKAARELGGGEKIDVAVIMIGSNDKQAIHEGAETFETFSPRWRELYSARVEAIRAAFREKKIPLVWVGLPVMKSENFSASMAQLNEAYRMAAAKDGAPFIDVWEAFADEKNQYQAFGPDINGRIVKLRAGDGVHFTEAGARKLAHFVEGEIKRVFEASRRAGPEASVAPAEPAGPTPEAPPAVVAPPQIVAPGAPALGAAPALPERPAVGPVQSLTAVAAGGDGELAKRRKPAPAADGPNSAAARALVEHVFVEGGDPPRRPGRADDFSWPRSDGKKAAPQ